VESSYHQKVSNIIHNRGSPDDGPLGKMRISTKNDDGCAFGMSQTTETFTIPNYEEEECRMKRTHANNTTTISSRHTYDGD
jgi:hypothetical protein